MTTGPSSGPDRAPMIRVDQAGEFGATRIYAGQLAVMGDRGPHSAAIRAMAAQEVEHRAAFDALIASRAIAVVQPDLAKWGGVSGVLGVIERIKALGATSIRKMDGIEETVKFPLPKGLKVE